MAFSISVAMPGEERAGEDRLASFSIFFGAARRVDTTLVIRNSSTTQAFPWRSFRASVAQFSYRLQHPNLCDCEKLESACVTGLLPGL